MGRAWLAATTLALATLGAMSSHAALKAIAGHPEWHAASDTRPRGYEMDEHFPGAALLLDAEAASAAPPAATAGTTGTATLPALPVSAAVAEALVRAEPAGVVAALPFALGRAGATDRARALECLTAAIYYEAGSESAAGQQAVAQVVLNRARHPAFPPTVCGVVYQGSERAGCQFSFACDGAMRRVPSAAGWARATRVAAAALAGYVYAPVGLATHYHTYAVTPSWNRALVMTDMVGAHLFHRWKGYWGTSAAFRQVYLGGEPLPGPHAAVQPLVIAATAPVPVTPAAAIRPAYADSGAITNLPSAEGDRLPPSSTLLARWRDAGTMR